MKKMICIFAALLISVSSFSAMSVYAEPDTQNPFEESFEEDYAYTDSVMSFISISGSSATCISEVIGKTGTTRIVVTQTLQKYGSGGWYDYKPAKVKTFNSHYAWYENTYTGLPSGSYRTKTTALVSKGSNHENVGPSYS